MKSRDKRFIGVDVGSVTTKVVLCSDEGRILFEDYIRNEGGPIGALQAGFRSLSDQGFLEGVSMVGVTGSGRELARVLVGADVVKNEISSHAKAASFLFPDIGTLVDIGGQDSKIVFFRDGYPTGFNMNTVCAAGTGSFLDHQATRLGIPIEEFGDWALRSRSPARIAGRCGVFAESDLIHKQQMGYRKEDLIAGLCGALATNYVTNVARGQRVRPRVVFQGGVAANAGIRQALEERLGFPVTVPPHFKVMGAFGAALLARERWMDNPHSVTSFLGVGRIATFTAQSRGFQCAECANSCEIQEIVIDGRAVARWGSKCGKWEDLSRESPHELEVVSSAL